MGGFDCEFEQTDTDNNETRIVIDDVMYTGTSRCGRFLLQQQLKHSDARSTQPLLWYRNYLVPVY
jgi:hypothetical protein